MFEVGMAGIRGLGLGTSNSHSGYYWCAVEIAGSSDDGDYLYLTVSSDPAVSVIISSASGQGGGSVSVQGLYSAEYQNKQKK
ncbi:hypothetical protein MHYP_G00238130 [Metynnis hypsauchen]